MSFSQQGGALPEMRERVVWFSTAAIIFLFILLSAISADKPLTLDSAEYPAVAKQLAVTGMPIYYRGEATPRGVGIAHPPLYIYLLAAWFKLFGFGETQVRLFGVTSALMHGAIVLWMVRTLFGAATAFLWQPFFWALFLLNPYTLQTSAIADIDSTIYGPLLCLMLLAALRISWRDGEWRTDTPACWEFALVGLAAFFGLWAKLTTIWLVFPVLFLLFVSRMGVRKAALATAAVTGGSVLAFVASYYLFGAMTGLDVSVTFGFIWNQYVQRGSSGVPGLAGWLSDRWANLQFMGPFMTRWTGLLPWVAGGVAVCQALISGIRRKDRRDLHYGIVLGLGMATTFYYCAKLKTFGYAPQKYTFVYWGLVLTAPLYLLAPVRWPSRKALAGLLAICAATAVWAMLGMRDRLMLEGLVGPYRFAQYLPAVLLLVALAARSTRAGLALAMAAMACYCGLQLGIGIAQERTPYSTTYDYGETGFRDTVAFLQQNTGPDEIVSCMKDIGFRYGRRYFENYAALYGDSASEAEFREGVANGRFAFMVFTDHHGQDQLIMNQPLRQWFLAHTTLVRSFGDYRIYKANTGRPVEQ